MSNLESRIQAFEKKYLAALRRWGGFVDLKDLDLVQETFQAMKSESEAITKAFSPVSANLYARKWQPLLKDVLGLLQGIQTHLERIRLQSRQSLATLEKGQRGLAGYRSSFQAQRSILDQDG